MHLVIMTTDRCNAACAHCSTSCGPQRTVELPRAAALRLMSEAAAATPKDQPLDFCISGGEPFLDFELLLTLVAHSRALGGTMMCVSNAYWASSQDKALRLLAQLKSAGLTALAVSSSNFHEQFIKRSRVQRALLVAQDLGLETQLKFVSTQSDPADTHPVTLWARAAGVGFVQEIPLMPTLRAGAQVNADEYVNHSGLPQGLCPAPVMTVRESGEAYTCCTPGAHNPLLSLGNAQDADFATLERRFVFGAIQRVLREQGPAGLAAAVKQAGQGSRLRGAYGGVCDLCTHLTQDPIMGPLAQDYVSKQAIAELQSIFSDQASNAAVSC